MIDFSKFKDNKPVKVVLKTLDNETPTVYYGLVGALGGLSPSPSISSEPFNGSCHFTKFPSEKAAKELDYDSDFETITLDSSYVESVELLN